MTMRHKCQSALPTLGAYNIPETGNPSTALEAPSHGPKIKNASDSAITVSVPPINNNLNCRS